MEGSGEEMNSIAYIQAIIDMYDGSSLVWE